jgi:hypothetical protein
MGLKLTHIIIITCSILLAGFFSYQMYLENTTSLFMGGTVTTVGLIYYMSLIIKKFKTI